MNFRGHLIGGMVVGVTLAESAARLGGIPSTDRHTWFAVCATTLFFSLLPDLDTSSVPQRWFFRLVFIGLLYLGWNKRYELATLVGILAIMPLLDHHRGWMHWKWTPLFVPLLASVGYEYWRARQSWFIAFSWSNVQGMLDGYAIFVLASIAGWYCHLILDGRFNIFKGD